MFTQEHMQTPDGKTPTRRPQGVIIAKRTLKDRGWSYRRAAPVLGVTYQHLCEVLNGHRISRRLVQKIAVIEPAASPARG
jgi:plasmid maintenance system antidote protein VapI